jgi:hypothetical protein
MTSPTIFFLFQNTQRVTITIEHIKGKSLKKIILDDKLGDQRVVLHKDENDEFTKSRNKIFDT